MLSTGTLKVGHVPIRAVCLIQLQGRTGRLAVQGAVPVVKVEVDSVACVGSDVQTLVEAVEKRDVLRCLPGWHRQHFLRVVSEGGAQRRATWREVRKTRHRARRRQCVICPSAQPVTP